MTDTATVSNPDGLAALMLAFVRRQETQTAGLRVLLRAIVDAHEQQDAAAMNELVAGIKAGMENG